MMKEASAAFSLRSYFMVNADGQPLAQQRGIFRSNCMDCLDRTNVIQSLLARRSLQSQLQVIIMLTAKLSNSNRLALLFHNLNYLILFTILEAILHCKVEN